MTRSAACLIVKNEADDIAEWLVHHHLIGFDTLIVYDHQSTDRTADIVRDLSRDIPIILRDWTNQSRERQNGAYRDCLAKDGPVFDWIAFLDADEFLVSDNGESLPSLLGRQEHAASIVLNWLIFGTSSLNDLGGRPVLDALTRRAPRDFDVNRHVKSIVRPSAVRRVINPHVCEVNGITVHADGGEAIWERPGLVAPTSAVHTPWRVHHYFLRTAEHWQRRLARGQLGTEARQQAQFEIYDRNEEPDGAALLYAARNRRFLAERTASGGPTSNILCVLDCLEKGSASGWAFDRDAPAAPIGFTALVDGEAVVQVDCGLPRPDLLTAGYPERSGFNFAIPAQFRDGSPHILSFTHENAGFGFHRDGEKLEHLEFCLHG
jgi:hypothetical protein